MNPVILLNVKRTVSAIKNFLSFKRRSTTLITEIESHAGMVGYVTVEITKRKDIALLKLKNECSIANCRFFSVRFCRLWVFWHKIVLTILANFGAMSEGHIKDLRTLLDKLLTTRKNLQSFREMFCFHNLLFHRR